MNTITRRTTSAISRTAAVVIVVIIIIAAVAGAYYYVSRPSTTAQTALNVLVVPADDTAPVYIAIQKGYFAQEGLNVTIKVVGSPSLEFDALSSGSAQIGLLSTPSLMSAYEQHFNYSFIAPATIVKYPSGSPVGSYIPPSNGQVMSPHAVVVLASSGITSLTQLPGKTVGMASLPIEVGMNVVLGDLGVNASKVNYQIIATPSLLTSLEQKRVDAVSLLQPFTTQMILANESGPTAGQFRIIGDDQHYSDALIAGWIASPTWANSHSDIVKKFLTALSKGVGAVSSNTALVQQYIVNYLGINSTVAAQMPLPVYYSNSTLPYSYIQNQINAGIKYGIFKSTDNASQIVNSNFLTLTSS